MVTIGCCLQRRLLMKKTIKGYCYDDKLNSDNGINIKIFVHNLPYLTHTIYPSPDFLCVYMGTYKCYCKLSSNPIPFIIEGGSTFSKLMEIGGLFCQKSRDVRQNGGCHIILRFFWGFVMMQHAEKNLDLFIFPFLTNMFNKIIS